MYFVNVRRAMHIKTTGLYTGKNQSRSPSTRTLPKSFVDYNLALLKFFLSCSLQTMNFCHSKAPLPFNPFQVHGKKPRSIFSRLWKTR